MLLLLLAILKSDGVLAVFSGKLNTPEEIFQDLVLSKIQQVFASAYKDIQRLIWNIQGENSEKMLLRAKQKLQAQFAY